MENTATGDRPDRSPRTITVPGGPRIDWKAVRDQIDLAAVATSLLGPAPGRRGERNRRLWWCCPFHPDRNPSFCVDPGKGWWRCFGCGVSGDAASLLMRLDGVSFPEAVARLTGGPAPTKPVKRPALARRPEPQPEPSGLPEADALALVEAAAARLWTPKGADALAYLAGPARCLTHETIRAARLGVTPPVAVPRADGTTFQALGVVVPWFTGGRLALVKLRQPNGRRPKYAEVYRDPARLVCYPGPEAIRPGHPLIVVEGEFDALCLGEALGDLAAVVTLGSASARPEPPALSRMLAAAPWYIATDADDAGDKAATGWPARARRVRPPMLRPHPDHGPTKAKTDWTDLAAFGVNLRRWWGDILAGDPAPPLFTWQELSGWRWGPAVDDPAPGLIVPREDIGPPRDDPELYSPVLKIQL